ncbi:MAG: glycosyltransferase family 39 protein [bacterium]|nr:glycosyltransferase family 39 protein [bacterium]
MKNKTNLFIFLIIVLNVLIRLPYTNIPLFHADEAIYSLVAKDLLEGNVLYKGVWDHKPPGIYFIYALIFKLFSSTTMYYMRLFTIFWTSLITYFIFKLANYLYTARVGLLSALFFAIFSTTYIPKDLIAANSEIFMILPYVLCIYYFIKGEELFKPYLLIISGVFCGAAIFIKQPGIFNAGVVFFYTLLIPKILGNKFSFKEMIIKNLYFTTGIIMVSIPIILYFFFHNALWEFINEAFRFGFVYVKYMKHNFLKAFHTSINIYIFPNILIWCLSISSSIFILFNIFNKNIEKEDNLLNKKNRNILIILWAIFSFAGVSVGKKFEPHYFIQIIPVLSILSGYGVSILINKKYFNKILQSYSKIIIVSFLILGTIFPFQRYHGSIGFLKRYYYFLTNKYIVLSGEEQVSNYIKQNTKQKEKIFVWGNSPQIYFLSNRTPASRIVFNNAIVHNYFPKHIENIFFNEMIKDLIENRPTFFIDSVAKEDRLLDRNNISYYPALNSFFKNNYSYITKFKNILVYKLKT